MFKTKKDVDRHVRTALSKLHSDNEKNLRGFTIAKLYFKIHEYATAQHYVSAYLTVNEEYAPAHKLLGQCFLQLKKPDKALEAFQRSLNLDSKQPDLLIEVCKMLLADENTTSLNKAKYWCELAESENVQHNAVFSLRLKLLNKSCLESTEVEQLILKEIAMRPTDPMLRVRVIKHFIEQNKIMEAFKYAYDLEMNNHSFFANCIDWYNIVWLALSKFRQLPNTKKSWDFWLLSMICIERQVDMSFTNMNSNLLASGGTTDTANLLFTFDQHLFDAAKAVVEVSPEKELGAQFLYHFRGQLCLHAATLIYRREQVLNKNQWREASKNALPVLLFAYYCGTPDTKESWLKHSGEKTRQLIQMWHREGSFRCAQAGRTLLSLVDNKGSESLSTQVHSVISDQSGWASADDILSHIRQHCSDTSWRAKLFRILFPSSDQLVKIQSSHLVNSVHLAEPSYELPKRSEIEAYEEVAQYLRPESLQHMVYLCLGMDNLCDVSCRYFSGLNFSTQNLAFCGAESLTRLDVETFLCAAVIQAQRSYEVERMQYESYNAKNVAKPKFLPYANMSTNLCTEQQTNWWHSAYQVYKNLAGDNLPDLRATLQYGIEAVRGINGPKMDLVIILKLGKVFLTRAQDASKSMERSFLDARAINLYKYGLTMLKLHNRGVLEPFRKLFKYNNANSAAVEREINSLAEEAVTVIATRHFKKGDYEECIEELSGIQLPYATYFQAEAYRKLDESNKTPKKTKKFYCDKAKDCLEQTLQLLNFSADKNHPLKSIVQSDMKRTQYAEVFAHDDLSNDIETREEYLNESFNQSRTQRELQTSLNLAKASELENLIKQMMNTLTFVKEELVERIKPEVSGIKDDLSILKDKVLTIEESMKKRSEPPSRDDGTKDFENLYIIGEDLQPVVLSQYNQAQQQQQAHVGTQQRMQTPNALLNQQSHGLLHGAAMPAGPSIYNSTLYNPMAGNLSTPLMNQHAPHGQFSTPGAASNVYNTPYNPNYPFNYYSQFVMPPGVMNMGLSAQQPQPAFMPPAESNPSLYDILNLPNIANANQATEKTLMDKGANQQSMTAAGTWGRLNNNAPVEKSLPVNVVITNSDPLPAHTTVSTQSTLSVTIPPHHIKPSLVPNDFSVSGISQAQTNTSFPIIASNLPFGNSVAAISSAGSSVTATKPSAPAGMGFPPLKSIVAGASDLNKSAESTEGDVFNRSAETEYEPKVDFQPVIPLPDEVEVKTGEENEDVLFCSRASLLRLIEKEWKERGIGELKILRSKSDGKIRILMRREQTHKLCANHYLSPEIKLVQKKGDEKSFIWCADDFADEVMKREKLCARFKQVDAAKEFHKAFLQAQDELRAKGEQTSKNVQPVEKVKQQEKPGTAPGFSLSKSTAFNFGANSTSTPKPEEKNQPEAQKNITNKPVAASASPFSKLTFGMADTAAVNKEVSAAEATKPSPFANFSFSTAPAMQAVKTDSPFANIFSKPLPTTTENNANVAQPMNLTAPKSATDKEAADKVNASEADPEDEYEPTAQFQPVIPLPDLVEVQTGEENEDTLFEHRAKLYRYDKSTSAWKERGVGVMKVLVDRNDANKVRLVMRREQVLKLCCNQRLQKDAVFKFAQNSTKSMSWIGQDYSDSELQTEILTIRFKTADICNEFHRTILKAQEKMTDVKLVDSLKNGIADGNIETRSYEKPTSTNAASKDSVDRKSGSKLPESGFGDQFKPKAGSWDCSSCYTSNNANTLYCIACEEPKDDTVPKKSGSTSFTTPAASKNIFSFGFGTAGTNKQTADAKPQDVGFGDQFKPKLGSWACQACYVTNDAATVYCNACEAPKDDTIAPKKPASNSFAPSSTAPKFQFGFSPTTGGAKPAAKDTSTAVTTEASVTSTTGSTFSNPNPFDFGPKTGFVFGSSSTDTANNVFSSSIDGKAALAMSPSTMFGVTNDAAKTKSVLTKLVADLSQKPAANGDGKSGNDFKLEKQQFNFTMKPKSPGKAKSPAKNVSGVDEEESEEEDIEEENNTYFAPVIPLPEKVDVVTGEENEEELYCHRAKLYRFTSGEWKERGTGDLKILRHKQTGKLRVVMRREKIHKICLNHVLTPDIDYKPKDEKSWRFAANDFSEGEFQSTVFSLRFKNKEIAERFMLAVKAALDGSSQVANDPGEMVQSADELGLSDDQMKLADRLMLPYSFYRSEAAEACPGCRGCDPDGFVFNNETDKNALLEDQPPIPLAMPQITTPNKSILKQSVLASPSVIERSENVDSSPKNIFGGSSLFTIPNSVESNSSGSNAKDQFTFSLDNTQNTEPKNNTEPKFASGGFLFGTSKTTFGSTSDNAKPIFGQTIFGNVNNVATTNPTIFGGSSNNIFGSPNANVPAFQPNKEAFNGQSGGESQSNLFSSLNLKPQDKQAQPMFGGKPTFTFGAPNFGSTFSSNNSASSIFGGTNNRNVVESTTKTSAPDSVANNKENEPGTEEPLFKNDPGLSFASLAATAESTSSFSKTLDTQSSGGFVGLKQTGGFSIFLTGAKDAENKLANNSNTSQDGAGHEEGAYDPHYDPIIELPELITVSTGEENEEKIFGERGVLYRYDTTNREWKERGTGELKILYHPDKGTYRLLLRREQIHKLVLNHAITADFQLKPMNTSGKSFCWGAMNYAETPPELERLAARFKNADIANRFQAEVMKCVEKAKQRGAELEPEDD